MLVELLDYGYLSIVLYRKYDVSLEFVVIL